MNINHKSNVGDGSVRSSGEDRFELDGREQALVELGRLLRCYDYGFIPASQATLEHSVQRSERMGLIQARNLREVFGFGLPFHAATLPEDVWALLRASECVRSYGSLYLSEVAYAAFDQEIYVHSSCRIPALDAVHLLPASYRFRRFVQIHLQPGTHLVDIGTGCGVGGLSQRARVERMTLVDINPLALRFARVNAALADQSCAIVASEDLDSCLAGADRIIAFPPFLNDADGTQYVHGGGSFGEAFSVRIVAAALRALPAGGQLLLYGGATMIEGVDMFWQMLKPLVQNADVQLDYCELDPDIESPRLQTPDYFYAERIAAIGLNLIKRR